ncbi:tRNA (N6-threonylcarbamoyladenosine(37)-N6)-methyltransferase TrmO [Marivita sp.]|jgi:tRNA-Thr(GGU) m(6)t(6)A37 methyltransferase TsaA|uniref:tRNA (N6-threonylcarbamoyladenosine(37)-N6)-methyltransferase TrmO n=1 Tax=Marivita sp. TaxID=2003365 RepID=UPI003F6F0C51
MTTADEADLRDGEVATDRPVSYDAAVQFIGTIRTPYTSRDMCPRQGALDGPDCRLELLEEWAPALKGITRFDYLDVLYWLHLSRRDLVLQSPRSDGSITGTFALRSPVRPNPIGISKVRLIRQEGSVLIVKGLDCLDKTPLIDIKPERCSFTPQAPHKDADDT